MTNLLLKTQTELFKWLRESESERERVRERERERQTDTGSGGEFWEAAGIYIRSLVSIQSSPN